MATCTAIDPLVTPYIDRELSPADRSVVDDHLGRCAPCRARVDAERAARAIVHARRASLEAAPAPESLRARCRALGRSADDGAPAARGARAARPAGRWLARAAPLALAASLVVLVGGAFLYRATGRSPRVLAAELAADHVKCFAIDDALGTRETPAAVEQAIQTGFGWHLTVAEQLAGAGLDLVGARRCVYMHGLIAHLMYRRGGQAVSVFMLPHSVHAESLVEVLGHEAAIWSSGDRTFVLVARGSRADVQRMAVAVRAELH